MFPHMPARTPKFRPDDKPEDGLVRVNVNLFVEDVSEIKRRAARDVRFWHAILRDVVHAALNPRKPRIR